MYNIVIQYFYQTSKATLMVKNLPANAGDTRDAGDYQKNDWIPLSYAMYTCCLFLLYIVACIS